MPTTATQGQCAAQTTGQLMMIRPANFGSNPETAIDNAFQQAAAPWELNSIAQKAREEFDAFVEKLQAAGVQVLVVEDTPEPPKTDAVFPNNWITTHEDGIIVTYPMYSPIRQRERRMDIIELLFERFGFSSYISLEDWELLRDRIVEGTGSMILDRENRIVYACLSQRTNEEALLEWAQMMRFKAVYFTATDAAGVPIYHTNVMMALGTTHAVVCMEVIRDEAEQAALRQTLSETGKTIVEISLDQMNQFAGNMLEVKGSAGAVWAMSSSAYAALQPEQIGALSSGGKLLLHSDLSTIETYGGGSARCMMAEIFVP